MKKLIGFIVAMAILASMASHEAMARELTDKEKAVIMKAVKRELKDPESARFKWVAVNTKETVFLYCGLVNSKNSYGGYVGDQLFSTTIVLEKGKASLIGTEVENAEWIAIQCRESGYTDFSSAQ